MTDRGDGAAQQLLKGTLPLVVLSALESRARHGHEIMHWIRAASAGAYQLQEGAIYPVLHRLEKDKQVRGRWGVSENNRQAKYYELTARGRKNLARRTQDWQSTVETMAHVLATDRETAK